MFLAVAAYELKYRLTRISTHVYAVLFFALAFLLGLSAAGGFDSVSVASNALANSPYLIAGLVAELGLFGVIVTASFMGHALVKDFENGMHPLLFTTPLSKAAYLGGRFTGAAIANLYVMLAMVPGLMVAFAFPTVDPDTLGAFRAAAYVQPFLTFVVPNVLITGAVFFALAATTRSMLPNYVGGVLLLVGWLVAGVLAGDTELLETAALVDPFGLFASQVLTRYWTPAEQNALLVPVEGVLLWNRVIWLAVGAAAFAVASARFSFSQTTASRRRGAVSAESPGEVRRAIDRLALPSVSRDFGLGAHLRQMLSLAWREALAIVRNVYFYVLILAALGFLAVAVSIGDSLFGTPTLPVTAQVVQLVSGSFTLFVLVIIVFYSGELIWRERDLRSNLIYDALPVPTWLPFAAKLLAMWAVIAVLLATMTLAGIVYQLANGFTDIELGLYAREFFGVQFVDFALLAVLAMFVHTLVNHKYVGHFVILVYLIGVPLLLNWLGLENNLYDYGSDAGTPYSDMNRYGPFFGPFVWFKLYWAAFAVLLAAATTLLWSRGQGGGVAQRLRLAGLRLSRPVVVQVALALVAFLVLGGFIFYNTNVLNEYRPSAGERGLRADYERTYKTYETLPQPRITAVDLDVDLYPSGQDGRFRGTYTLLNKTGTPIPAVHLNLTSDVEVRALGFEGGATASLVDSTLGYRIYDLARPLAPGDSLEMTFDLALETVGFQNQGAETRVVENGTFVNSALLPHVGYQPSAEIEDASERRKEGLPPRPRTASIDDTVAVRNTYIANDADFIRFAATVSTEPDQIAIAPGYLEREWTENGRRYFRYEMDAPILNFYAFLSARYAVDRGAWTSPEGDEVAIEVYHHPAHTYNVERMMEAVKASLSYFSEHFSPYQHRQVRIIEFPNYAQFAQSFPNTIPFSESIGFIADIGSNDIDYPFYVTAHEVAHQWFAHQIIGGNVQGATVLSETLSQYGALMVMKERYGADAMPRFLGYELDQYLLGRTLEREKEVPLYLNEGAQYIHYNKGSLSMYALQDAVGEDRVNDALAALLDRYAFRGPPYPTSRSLVAQLRAVTPDSLQGLVTDLFETITLYENRAVEARATPLAGGRQRVAIDLDLKKLQADSTGAESEVPMNDWLDVAVYGTRDGGEEEILAIEKRRFRAGEQTVTLDVEGTPTRAGVDPRFLFVDRNKGDNTVAVASE